MIALGDFVCVCVCERSCELPPAACVSPKSQVTFLLFFYGVFVSTHHRKKQGCNKHGNKKGRDREREAQPRQIRALTLSLGPVRLRATAPPCYSPVSESGHSAPNM